MLLTVVLRAGRVSCLHCFGLLGKGCGIQYRMNCMRQIRVALIGSFLLFICTAGVGLAEGEAPPPSPSDSGIAAAIVIESAPQPANADTAAAPNDPASGGTDTDSAPEPLPEPETWRPVVNSLRPGYWEASILPVRGLAMYYNPGVFQRVLDFRYKNDHISECAECIGYVALLRAGDIDRRVWLQREGEMLEGPFWVVDVAAGKDIPRLLSENWIVDVDHATAMRWRMAGPIPVTVYAADSPEAEAAAAAQASATQTLALIETVYKCAIVPLESHAYQVLDALADSATCLISGQSDLADGSADAETAND